MPWWLEIGYRKRFRLLLLWRRWWKWMVLVVCLLPLGPWPMFPFLKTLLERIVQRYQCRYRFRRVCRIRDGRLLRRFWRARHRYRLRRTLAARSRVCRSRPWRGRRGARGRRRSCRCGRGRCSGHQRAYWSCDCGNFFVKVVRRPGTLFFIHITLHWFLFRRFFWCDPASIHHINK